MTKCDFCGQKKPRRQLRNRYCSACSDERKAIAKLILGAKPLSEEDFKKRYITTKG